MSSRCVRFLNTSNLLIEFVKSIGIDRVSDLSWSISSAPYSDDASFLNASISINRARHVRPV
jgi:hypothetical protein